MKIYLLSLCLFAAACSSKKEDPTPTPPPGPTAPVTVDPVVKMLRGKWTLERQVFATQPSPSQSQVFAPAVYYPTTGPDVTTFELKDDGTAVFTAGPSTNQPGPGPSATGPYQFTQTTPTIGNIKWAGQTLVVNILESNRMVLDRVTINTNGSINTEQRHYVR